MYEEGQIPSQVIVSGATGDREGQINGIFVRDESDGEPPTFQKQSDGRLWLYLADAGEGEMCWAIGPEDAKAQRSPNCFAHSQPLSRDGELPHEVALGLKWDVIVEGNWEKQAVLVVPASNDSLQGAIQGAWKSALDRVQEQPMLVVAGASGHQAGFVNGIYRMQPPEREGEGPVYQHQQDTKRWLFMATDHKWWFGPAGSKDAKKPSGCAHSDVVDPGVLPDRARGVWQVSTKEGFKPQALRIMARSQADIDASVPLAWQELLAKVKAQPVVDIRGATGQNADWVNGEFELVEEHPADPSAPPFAYKHRPPRAGAPEFWLFYAKDGSWCIGPSQAKASREPQGVAVSGRVPLGALPPAAEQWRVITKPGTAEAHDLVIQGAPGVKDFWASRIDRWKKEEVSAKASGEAAGGHHEPWRATVREMHREMTKQLTSKKTLQLPDDDSDSDEASEEQGDLGVVEEETRPASSSDEDVDGDDGDDDDEAALARANKKVEVLERKTKKAEKKVQELEKQPCELEELAPEDDLWRDVDRMFREQGLGDCHIKRIQKTHMREEHVQEYEANRRQKEDKLLWFGTSVFEPMKVLQSKHGMDYRFSSFGKLGRGLYGAELAVYSDSCFAYEDAHCQRQLILFRGITGKRFDYTKAPTASKSTDWAEEKGMERDPLTRTLKKSRTYSAPPQGYDSVTATAFCDACLSVKPGETMTSKCSCPWTPHEYQPELYSSMLGLEGGLALKRRRVSGPIICLYPPRDHDCDASGDSQPWSKVEKMKPDQMQPYVLAVPVCLVEYVRKRKDDLDATVRGSRSLHQAKSRIDAFNSKTRGTIMLEEEPEEPIWRVWYNNTMEEKKQKQQELSMLDQEIDALTHALKVFERRLDVESESRRTELIEARKALEAVREELAKARRRRDELEARQSTAEEMNDGDVCALDEVSESSLVNVIHQRYLRKCIYTRADRTVIAVNPFQALGIYSSQVMERYRKATNSLDLPPHIYSVAFDALNGLRCSAKNQAILISGESGAGKTESKKLILHFISEAISAGDSWSHVMSSLPVVEAFGNAMTVRNNNSSRFGKWVDLCFSQNCDFKKCCMTSYLLELTRVCTQEHNERGYHIFFQVLQSGIISELKAAGCEEPGDFEYLRHGQARAPGIDDAEDFKALQEALGGMGLDAQEQLALFQVVAGVLMLGNCALKPDGEGTSLQDEDAARTTAKLWGVDTEVLKESFLMKTRMVGKEVMTSPLPMNQAKAARDTLARKTYGNLFLWIFAKINEAFGAEEGSDLRELGVLDLAGFECFEHNSLEQLLINFGNERLQQRFNEVMFAQEMKQCEEEGVPAPSNLGFVDNSNAVELLDKVVAALNETMTMQKPTEEAFMTKVTHLSSDPRVSMRISIPKVKGLRFAVAHFAGEVDYSCEGWLDKNAAHASTSLAAMLAGASNGIVKQLGAAMLEEQQQQAAAKGGKKQKTVTADFRESMKSLLEKIAKADTHYIRCVKPNQEKVPDRFCDELAQEQLLRSGVLTLVKIRQQGYSHRLPHRDFFNRFGRCLLWKRDGMQRRSPPPADPKATDAEVRSLVEEAVQAMAQQDMEMAVVGKTRVFVKMSAMRALEEVANDNIRHAAMSIKLMVLAKAQQKRFRAKRDLFREIDHCIRSAGLEVLHGRCEALHVWEGSALMLQVGTREAAEQLLASLAEHLAKAEGLHIERDHFRIAGPRALSEKLRKELEALAEAEQLAGSSDTVALDRCLGRGATLNMTEVKEFAALRSRLLAIRGQQQLISNMRAALDDVRDTTISELRAVLEEAQDLELLGGPERWLPELKRGAEMLEKVRAKLQEAEAKAKKPAQQKRVQVVEPAPTASLGSVAPSTASLGGAASAASLGSFGGAAPEGRRASLQAMRRQSFAALGASITGPLWEDVRRAAGELDAPALQRALRLAEQSAMPEDWPPASDPGQRSELAGEVANLGEARALYKQLQDEQFLLKQLHQAKAELKERHPPLNALRRLANLAECLAQLKDLDSAAAARHCVQQELIWRSKHKGAGASVFEASNPEELALATKAFGQLGGYSGIKKAHMRAAAEPATISRSESMQRSHLGRRWSLPAQPTPAESTPQTLSFSSTCLTGALTEVPEGIEPEAFERAAVQISRDLLQCMGDRFGTHAQMRSSLEALLGRVMVQPMLLDELYVQLLKQLDKNPSATSARRGWELLRRLCHDAPPRGELAEFVRHFLRSGGTFAGPLGSEVAGLARVCLEAVGKETSTSVVAGRDSRTTLAAPQRALAGRGSVGGWSSVASAASLASHDASVGAAAAPRPSRAARRGTLGGTLGASGVGAPPMDHVTAIRIAALEHENKELREKVEELEARLASEAKEMASRMLEEQRTSKRCWFGCRG